MIENGQKLFWKGRIVRRDFLPQILKDNRKLIKSKQYDTDKKLLKQDRKSKNRSRNMWDHKIGQN